MDTNIAPGRTGSRLKWRLALVPLAAAVILGQFWRPRLESLGPVKEPAWDSPRTRDLAQRACFDCHSNSTRFPWYHQVQPVRYLLDKHVSDAREALNFQSIDGLEDGREIARWIETKRMPLPAYLWMHPDARLSDSERQELAQGMRSTFP